MDDYYEDLVGKLTPIFRFALNEGISDIYLPTKGSDRASGWDVRCTQQIIIKAGEYAKIPLGFRIFSPPGWWLELRPRSSSFAKKKLHALYGVIDEDYEGQLVFACQYLPEKSDVPGYLVIQEGEAVGQIIPIRREEMKVEKVSNEEYERLCKERNSSRGQGGFGSTGR